MWDRGALFKLQDILVRTTVELDSEVPMLNYSWDCWVWRSHCGALKQTLASVLRFNEVVSILSCGDVVEQVLKPNGLWQWLDRFWFGGYLKYGYPDLSSILDWDSKKPSSYWGSPFMETWISVDGSNVWSFCKAGPITTIHEGVERTVCRLFENWERICDHALRSQDAYRGEIRQAKRRFA